jgi:hypothetical protein
MRSILFLIALAFSVASDPVTVSPDISAYVNGFTMNTPSYRSGRINKTGSASIPNIDAGTDHWQAASLPEYAVVYNSPSQKLEQYLRSFFNGFSYSYDSTSYIIQLISPNYSGSTQVDSLKTGFSKDTLIQLGMKYNIFKGFGNTLEYSNEEVTYVNDQIQMINLRYRRIFDNGIILGNVSYVDITLNGRGDIIRFRMKWPSFQLILSDQPSVMPSSALQDIQAIYTSAIQQKTPINENGEVITKSNIIACALAWRLLDDQSKGMIISPAFSFEAQISVNNKNRSYFIDVPALKKYRKKS